MRRLLSYVPRKRVLVILALLAGGGLWIAVSRWAASHQPPLAELVAVRCIEPESKELEARILAAQYSIENGKVLDAEAPAPPDRSEEGETDSKSPGKADVLDVRQAYKRAKRLAEQTRGRVFKATITPHWLVDNTHFWYRNDLKGGAKEFILVDAERGKREPAFDHIKLAEALSKASGTAHPADKLPFDSITFTEGLKAVQFKVAGASWQCDLTTYACSRDPEKAKEVPEVSVPEPEPARNDAQPVDDDEGPPQEMIEEPQQKKKGKFGGKGFGTKGLGPQREATSPDKTWIAFIKDQNVFLRDKDGKETQVTTNGAAGNAHSSVSWSPDSKTVLTHRTEPGDNKEVYMIETSPRDQLAAKLHTRVYPRPGDKYAMHEMWLIDVETKKSVKVDVDRVDSFRGIPRPRWSKDGKHFTFERTDRGHQRFRIIEVDARTGQTRDIYDETASTFIDVYSFHFTQYLDESAEILHTSERDGWKHLYLIDAKTGSCKQVTKGEWVVRAVDRVDMQKRQIWFRASGKNPDQDPYFIHYYRIDFDGNNLVALTEGNGDHGRKEGLALSPDQKYFIDSYSRVDMAPVHELRRASDGSLVCKLEQADISDLLTTGWRLPEVFVAKARDGKTDTWGVVFRPQNYDPNKKYPVIENIYAGPQGSFAPKTFAAYRPMQALAELGFIVVQMDGMGTANRSRAFHDVCCKNLADAGFPDRILWIKALATNYAYVDISRVGIYGTSAGGQNSTGAVLFHPEFYKVAVSSCGCHDNRLDKASWNEQWMGLLGPHYEKQSNVTHAAKLEGKLLLIVGELDTNVPFESTMRVADALIRARKDFELIFIPGMGHSGGGPYGDRRRWDFFVRHLHGVEPPERNGARAGATER